MARTQTERKNDWNKKVYDRVSLVVKAGDRAKQVNRFILEAINAAHPGLISILDDTSKQKKQAEPEADL